MSDPPRLLITWSGKKAQNRAETLAHNSASASALGTDKHRQTDRQTSTHNRMRMVMMMNEPSLYYYSTNDQTAMKPPQEDSLENMTEFL